MPTSIQARGYRIDEVKEIRDKVIALAAYARQAKNIELERKKMGDIRSRAERQMGEILKELARAPTRH